MKFLSNVKKLMFDPGIFLSKRMNENWTHSLLYLVAISLFLNLILVLLDLLYQYIDASYSLTFIFLFFGMQNIVLTVIMALITHFVILFKKMKKVTKTIQVFCYAQTPLLLAQFVIVFYIFLLRFSPNPFDSFFDDYFIFLVSILLLLIGILLMVSIINDGFKIVYDLPISGYLNAITIPIFLLIVLMTERFNGAPFSHAIFVYLPSLIMGG